MDSVPSILNLAFCCFPLLLLCFLMTRKLREIEEMKRPFDSMRRPAGFSLRQRADGYWTEAVCAMFAALLLAVGPIFLFLVKRQESLSFVFLSGCLLVPVSFLVFSRKIRHYLNYSIGARGEEAVGAELASLQGDKVLIFHDIPIWKGNRIVENIDHVILTPNGLVVVETKTRRKKRIKGREKAMIQFDGNHLIFPDGFRTNGPLEQARRTSTWLSIKAKEWTGGQTIATLPVVTYPGWWIERKGRSDVRVLNHKEFPSLMSPRSEPLSEIVWITLRKHLEELSRIDLEILGQSSNPKASGASLQYRAGASVAMPSMKDQHVNSL